MIEAPRQEDISDLDLRKWMSWADFAFDPASKQICHLNLIQLIISAADRDFARKLSLVFDEDEQLAPLRGKGILQLSIISSSDFLS